MEFVWFVVLLVASSVAEEELPWWRTTTLYEVYPRSFKDSDGDGTGDFKGIIQNINYIKEIGADALWLTPFFSSPMTDFGYDISDHFNIAPTFGTMDDFDALSAKCKELGLKLVMDFVPNHTSDKHAWFQMSIDPTHPLHQHYRDFYVWLDSKGTTSDGQPIPPNNWLSLFGGSAWKWSDQRKQFYLHHFAVEQPDLNYANPNVVGNMTEVLGFWIDKGIDGFRVDAPDHMFEDPTFPDEKFDEGEMVGSDFVLHWFEIDHTAMLNQPATFKLLDDWADYLYLQGLEKRRQIGMFMEIYAPLELSMKYYGTGKKSLKIPFNFLLQERGNANIQPAEIKDIIDPWVSQMPKDGVANWVLGNHDNKRVATKFGSEMVDTMNLITGVLPGVQVTYSGEEIGMSDTAVSWEQAKDPYAIQQGPINYQNLKYVRDNGRTPMQWDDSLSAGFSTNKTTWLPVNPNYWWLNVEAQKAAPVSHLKVFQAMTKARKDPVLQRGDLKVHVPDKDTLIVVRSYNNSYFTLVANLGATPVEYTTQNLFSRLGLDMDMSVVVGSLNSGYTSGAHFKKGSLSFTLRPKASILLKSGSPQLLYSYVVIGLCILMSKFFI